MTAKVAAIVGVGPGLGRALALRFSRGGFAVALLARQEESLRSVHAELTAEGRVSRPFACDATDEASVRDAFTRVRDELGAPDVLVYNAGAFQMGGVMELSPADFERAWRGLYEDLEGRQRIMGNGERLDAGRRSIEYG